MTAILSQTPVVRPTVGRAALAMTARDLRVMRRSLLMNMLRIMLQPMMFVLVFAYVLPKISPGGGSAFGASGGKGTAFSTIMVPGLAGSTMFIQSLMAVTMALMGDLTGHRGSIEDRTLAPLPVWMIGAQRLVTAMIEGLFVALLVIPAALFIHAAGQQPDVHVSNWLLLVVVMLCGVLLSSALGMFLVTAVDPRHSQMATSLVIFPAMMLGCVYFQWSAMAPVRWLQIGVLVNPMVYMNEGLRAVLTPQLGHMPMWAYLLALVGGAALFTWLALRSFVSRVTT
jgi:ABC-2 type transport system permease protein